MNNNTVTVARPMSNAAGRTEVVTVDYGTTPFDEIFESILNA